MRALACDERGARAGIGRRLQQPGAEHAGAEAERKRQGGGRGQKVSARHSGDGRDGQELTRLGGISPAPAVAATTSPATMLC